MLRRVAIVRTDVSEELSASFIGVTRIGEIGTTPAVTSTDARCEEMVLVQIYSLLKITTTTDYNSDGMQAQIKVT
jgi:hypothetical protein